jgi:hypothetical protein
MVSAGKVLGLALIGTAGYLIISGSARSSDNEVMLDRAPPQVPQFGRVFGLNTAGQAPFVTPPPVVNFGAPSWPAVSEPLMAPVVSSSGRSTKKASSSYSGLEGGFSVAPDSSTVPNFSTEAGPAYVPPPAVDSTVPNFSTEAGPAYVPPHAVESKKEADSGPTMDSIYSGVDSWKRGLNGGGSS